MPAHHRRCRARHQKRGKFLVVLAGGNTPRCVYRLLREQNGLVTLARLLRRRALLAGR